MSARSSGDVLSVNRRHTRLERLRTLGQVLGINKTMLFALPAVAFILAIFIYPFLYGLVLSFTPSSHEGVFGNYIAFFTDSFLRDSIWYTLRVAFPGAIVAVLFAIPISFQVRTIFGVPQRTMLIVLTMPMTFGGVLLSEGLLNFFGTRGWLNRFLMFIGLTDGPIRLTYNYWGVFIAEIVGGIPVAVLLISSFLNGIDERLNLAAATLGAKPLTRLRTITLPLLLPGIFVAMTLTFVFAFGVFAAANLVGQPDRATRVMSIVAYNQGFVHYDYSMAATVTIVMVVVELLAAVVLLTPYALLSRHRAPSSKG